LGGQPLSGHLVGHGSPTTESLVLLGLGSAYGLWAPSRPAAERGRPMAPPQSRRPGDHP
jgi:hypothetical protein